MDTDIQEIIASLDYWSRSVDVRARTANLIAQANPDGNGNFTSLKHATIFVDDKMKQYAKKHNIELDF